MGKPNPSFQKRLRERKKREKKEDKARRRAERIANNPTPESAEITDIQPEAFDDAELGVQKPTEPTDEVS